MLSSSRFVTDQHGSFELPKTAVLASRSPKDFPRRSRTYNDRYGATQFTRRIVPDLIRVDPWTGALHSTIDYIPLNNIVYIVYPWFI
ncbi:hypothetical protein DPMN_048274 [Dreissena polymorpha]|uniref:Uncharacterized protein n=1 Tax=Dreissena polymorpha TaxID=45954 RepID=A0A9D4I276_DREPO|nr:hypothetical protein DPMN_048274 [Dreissena polymorpha]